MKLALEELQHIVSKDVNISDKIQTIIGRLLIYLNSNEIIDRAYLKAYLNELNIFIADGLNSWRIEILGEASGCIESAMHDLNEAADALDELMRFHK